MHGWIFQHSSKTKINKLVRTKCQVDKYSNKTVIYPHKTLNIFYPDKDGKVLEKVIGRQPFMSVLSQKVLFQPPLKFVKSYFSLPFRFTYPLSALSPTGNNALIRSNSQSNGMAGYGGYIPLSKLNSSSREDDSTYSIFSVNEFYDIVITLCVEQPQENTEKCFTEVAFHY